MFNSCPRCGEKTKGFMKVCGMCEFVISVQKNTWKKKPDESEDDE